VCKAMCAFSSLLLPSFPFSLLLPLLLPPICLLPLLYSKKLSMLAEIMLCEWMVRGKDIALVNKSWQWMHSSRGVLDAGIWVRDGDSPACL
jgi:hypothetical protein